MSRTCDVCGQPLRNYGGTWKCMTSPADHKKILDSLDRGVRNQKQNTAAQRRARKKNFRKKKK